MRSVNLAAFFVMSSFASLAKQSAAKHNKQYDDGADIKPENPAVEKNQQKNDNP